MTRYRKKPVEVEARQWRGAADDFNPIVGPWRDFFGPPNGRVYTSGDRLNLCIETLEGKMIASPGDWIIRVKGEYYPCKPDIFEATYEKVQHDPR